MLTVPAALALAVMPNEIVRVLFERGAYTADDTMKTAAALQIFALGLPAFVLIKVFSPAYFAREDTRTPMRYAIISLTANTIGSIALFFWFRSMGWMPHLGIAVATALGGWLNAALLWGTLRQRGQFELDARLLRNLPLIAAAAIAMAAALLVAKGPAAAYLDANALLAVKGAALAALIGLGLIVYGAIVLATGVMSLAQLRRFTRRRPDAPQ
jgi:putative peptidoglycan lipid II flippase